MNYDILIKCRLGWLESLLVIYDEYSLPSLLFMAWSGGHESGKISKKNTFEITRTIMRT